MPFKLVMFFIAIGCLGPAPFIDVWTKDPWYRIRSMRPGDQLDSWPE